MAISRASQSKQMTGDNKKKKKKKKSSKNWIQNAVKNPNALRKKLKVPKGENIPVNKLNKAANSPNAKTRKQAKLAMTFKKMNRGRG